MSDIVFDAWINSVEEDEFCSMATILQTENKIKYEPKRVYLNKKGKFLYTLTDKYLLQLIKEQLKEKLNENNPKSETIEIKAKDESTHKVFLDVYIPTSKIVIFGAGHDAIPVASYSLSLGFPTTVVDARKSFNTEKFFPETTRIIAHPESYEESVQITKDTYAIVMNHHIKKDRKTLQFVLKSNASYVGMLGPYSRRERILKQLYEHNICFTKEELSKLYNPVGLDIGAATPEEIAISILAEIIAVQKGHDGGFLHDKKNIHKHSPKYDSLLLKNEQTSKI